MPKEEWKPDLTVAVICERDGKFLLVEEMAKSSQQVVFNQPAGHIEEGESVIEALIRETLEETQRHLTPQALVGLYRLEADNGKTYFRYTFSGDVSEIDPQQQLDPDIIKTHWLTLEQIRSSKQLRSPLVLACIEDYLSGSRHPLDLVKEVQN